MDIVIIIIALLVSLVGLAIFSNRARSRYSVDFDLKPNCLMTRWPLLFVTGPRSLFYFSCYWNLYTPFLAEHGYEVFTLHLPWSDPHLRQARLEHFLNEQEKAGNCFHLFMDQPTLEGLDDFLRQRKTAVIKSLTEIVDADLPAQRSPPRFSALPFPSGVVTCPSSPHSPVLLKVAYHLHKFFFKEQNLPSLSTLGAPSDINVHNSLLLLERAHSLAEMDLRADA